MIKIVYRIYKKNETKLIAVFSQKEFAKKFAERLDFEVDIKRVLINDEGREII